VRQNLAHDERVRIDLEDRPRRRARPAAEQAGGKRVTGGGSVRKKTGEEMQFVFSELFTFDANLVKRLETWHIWLGNT